MDTCISWNCYRQTSMGMFLFITTGIFTIIVIIIFIVLLYSYYNCNFYASLLVKIDSVVMFWYPFTLIKTKEDQSNCFFR